MKSRQITERSISMLGIYFIQELDALQKLRMGMEKIEAVFEAVFLLQLARGCWSVIRAGELNIQKLRADIDSRINILEILAKLSLIHI